MKKERNNQGITLIALVITIIVLLILAAISIATLTGENGVLTKASKAEKETDTVETKEQIKLEIMGEFDEEKMNYTNDDVKAAVKKITGKDVASNTPIVKSKKGNDVNIEDLWIVKTTISFNIISWADNTTVTTYEVPANSVWTEEFCNSLTVPRCLAEAACASQYYYKFYNGTLGLTFPGGGYGILTLKDSDVVKENDPVIDGGFYHF